MKLRHLRQFVCLAEELSFPLAAQRLNKTTPALRIQIGRLEKEMGATLLSRNGSNLSLTDAGRVFLQDARLALAQANQAVALAQQAANDEGRQPQEAVNGVVGQLSIGYNVAAEFPAFSLIVDTFRKKRPDVHLAFHYLEAREQFDALSRGELDLGFLCPPPLTDTFDIQVIAKQPFVLVLPANHALASTPKVGFGALSQAPLIVYSRTLDPDSFSQIERGFVRAGSVMNVYCEVMNPSSMIDLVAAGYGVCIVPESARSICGTSVVCKPLEAPNIVRELAIAKKKGLVGLADSFYRIAVERICADAASA